MSKSLYEEAIADAEKLRELAEETAKNKVVEAVMPQIRDLVNRRILGEQLEDLEITDEEFFEPEVQVDTLLPPSIEDELDVEEDSTVAPVINVSAQGDVNIEVESAQNDDDIILSDSMAEALARLIKGDSPESGRLEVLENAVRRISGIFDDGIVDKMSHRQKVEFNKYYNHCLKEALNLRKTIILTELSAHEGLQQRLIEVIKEMRDMSNRQNIFDFLFEQGDDVTVDVEDEITGAEASEEVEGVAAEEPVEVDPEEAAEALEDLGAVLGLDVSVGETVEEVEVEEETVELGAEDADDAVDLDIDLEEIYGGSMDEVYEIDETMLRREINRMRKLREDGGVDAAVLDNFGGGEDEGDVFEVSEDDLINALADELGRSDVPTPKVEAARRRRHPRGRRRSQVVESRTQKKQLHQYRNALAGMKKQLVEMNLFNAKLLYANKLMQNKNLSTKQQRAIVEALDNAKTLREAKLLYKSLSESLSRRARGSKLNEGNLRTLGSSSRSTRSAQPASSGVEVDRWAVLAGIPGND